jgi:hypothetical protein
VNEAYNIHLGWAPIELPTFSIMATRSDTYDQSRLLQNTTADTVLFGAHYIPGKGLDLSYSASYTDSLDKLSQLEIQTQSQSARASYSGSFWGRVSLTTGYNVSLSSTDTSQQGAGVVSFQVFPFAGLSVTDTSATDIHTETLPPNGPLIDGNLGVSAGLNIGVSLSLSGDTNFREMGLDFGTATQVNNVLIWVNEQLAPDIANSFAWDVYTSADNLNWTFLQTVQTVASCPAVSNSCATFGPFVNRFSIDFQTVNTRYIKVATRPLSPTVPGATNPNYQNIFVTEMGSFLKKPAEAVRGANRNTGQQFSLSTSTRLVDGVYHIFSYNASAATSTANGMTTESRRFSLSNGLNLVRNFTIVPTLTASGRFSRDDSYDSSGARQGAYNYSAGLSAVPLPTLRGSLVYSGSTLDSGATSDALSLNSTAELYQGVSMYASGGVTSGTSDTGARSKGVNFRSGAGLVPHRNLTLSVNYMSSRTATTGANATSQRWEMDTTYRPFEALYLTAAVSRLNQTDRQPTTLHSYGLNWSPLLSGALQFSFAYTESQESNTDTLVKTYGPGLTWALARMASISASYFVATTSSPQGTSDVKSFSTQFKMTF